MPIPPSFTAGVHFWAVKPFPSPPYSTDTDIDNHSDPDSNSGNPSFRKLFPILAGFPCGKEERKKETGWVHTYIHACLSTPNL